MKNPVPDHLPPPPKGLSREAQRWWRRLHTAFDLADEDALFLLESALRSFDRAEAARRRIDQEGLTVTDRFGQAKAHPLTVVERDSRGQFLQGMKALNLDLEPLNEQPGRPPGSTHYPRPKVIARAGGGTAA